MVVDASASQQEDNPLKISPEPFRPADTKGLLITGLPVSLIPTSNSGYSC